MNEPMGTPMGETTEPKKSRTWLIVIIVLVVLCLCCLVLGVLGYTFGDQILEAIRQF